MGASTPFAAAVAQVRDGGLLAFPTETVWGLGADATSEPALERLRAWKGRDAGQPVSVLVTGTDALEALGVAQSETSRALTSAFWPGPLTIILPTTSDGWARGVAREDGAVGLRCSPDPTAAGLAEALASAGVGPLTATSLNRSGEPPIEFRADAAALCASDPALELLEPAPGVSASEARGALPSTVVDCTGPTMRVLREGAIASEDLARATAMSPERATSKSTTAPGNETSP